MLELLGRQEQAPLQAEVIAGFAEGFDHAGADFCYFVGRQGAVRGAYCQAVGDALTIVREWGAGVLSNEFDFYQVAAGGVLKEMFDVAGWFA